MNVIAMTKETVKSTLNLNTLLLVVVTGLSAWTLKTVFDMAVALSSDRQQLQQHEKAITRLDSRVSNLEYNTPRANDGRARANVP